jgi:hypothetical protein
LQEGFSINGNKFLELSKQFLKLVKTNHYQTKSRIQMWQNVFKIHFSNFAFFLKEKTGICDKMFPLHFYFSYFDIISHQTKR